VPVRASSLLQKAAAGYSASKASVPVKKSVLQKAAEEESSPKKVSLLQKAAQKPAQFIKKAVLIQKAAASNNNNNANSNANSFSSTEEERKAIRESTHLTANTKRAMLAALPTKTERLLQAAMKSAQNLKKQATRSKKSSYERTVDEILEDDTLNDETKEALILSLAPNQTRKNNNR
jgi:hypothetical protein